MSTVSETKRLIDATTDTYVRLYGDGFWPIPLYPPGEILPGKDKPTVGKEPYGRAWGLTRCDMTRWNFVRFRLHNPGIGLCLGPERGPGGAWLVDVEGDGPEAESSRERLFGGEVVETMGWSSRRGAHQLYLADVERLRSIMPGLARLEVKGIPTPGVYKSDRLPGLELRIGGYKAGGIVKQAHSACPPTVGEDKIGRVWTGPSTVAAVPDAFYATLSGLIVPKGGPSSVAAVPVVDPFAGLAATATSSQVSRDEVWTQKALADELGKLASATEGGRNDALNRAAYALGRFIPRYLDRRSAEAELRAVAERIGLGSGETEATIRSGIEAGMGNPKVRPETPDPRPATGPRPGPGTADYNATDQPAGAGPNEAPDDPHRLARIFIDAQHRHPDRTTLVYHNGEFHRWDAAYRPLPIQAVRAALTTSSKAEFDRLNVADVAAWVAAGEKGRKPTVAKVTTALTNNVVQALGGETLLDDKHAAPCWLDAPGRWPAAEVLPTRNALLHLPSLADRVSPHRIPPTPRFFCPYVTDYDLDEAAPAPANWLAFLDRLWFDDPDSISSLQEWFGYHLTPDTSQEKIGMLIGPKRSGKGTIAKVLTAMIGEANVCNPKFGALGSQFGTESLIGKMAAIITDARITSRTDIAQVVENLLTISGTDRQTIARKHKTDWSGNLPTKFTIISNELPRLADASGALPARMIIFQLKQSFYGQEDTKLFSARIRPEMPGILLWAVEGWKRLRDRGRLNQPASGQQLVEEMEELSSPISVFLRERCIIEPGREIITTYLYEAWVIWCEAMGNKNPGDQTALGRNLRSVMPHLVTKQCRVGNGHGRKYMGIDLSNPPARKAF